MIGYARVSMSDQDNQRQIDALTAAGVHPDEIFTDVASGRNMERRGWKACWRAIQPGDVLVIVSIDRLGRDLIEVAQTVRDLHAKGADLKVLGMDIDTRTITGRLVFNILASMAQWERELIEERTRSGLAAAKARGKIGGARPKNTTADYLAARKRIDKGEDASKVAASLPNPVTRGGLYKTFDRLRREGKLK